MRILYGVGVALAAVFLLGFLCGLYLVVGSGRFAEHPGVALLYALVVGAYALCWLGIPAAVVGGVVGSALQRRSLQAPPRAGAGAEKDRDDAKPTTPEG